MDERRQTLEHVRLCITIPEASSMGGLFDICFKALILPFFRPREDGVGTARVLSGAAISYRSHHRLGQDTSPPHQTAHCLPHEWSRALASTWPKGWLCGPQLAPRQAGST
ncbi:hypothetical protein IF2G_01440 [Cordyceps javanica]|nr:hypothetical protein IF2G_01440 [Cordyceps javanica]